MSKIILTHKIEIKPNETTKKLFNNYFGYSRYCFNRGLDTWNKMYDNGESPSKYKVRDHLKANKEDWEKKLSSQVLDTSIEDLTRGWSGFFNKLSNRPKFKSKKKSKNTFRFYRKNNSSIRIMDRKLYLPRFPYGIKMTENPRFDGVIKTCTISKVSNLYFASLSIELSDNEKKNLYVSKDDGTKCGIDLGLKTFAVVASEENKDWVYEEHKGIYRKLIPLYQRISHYQKMLSRKKKDSNKYNEVKIKLQRIYLRISHIQKDYLNKFTTNLIKNYHQIVIEDLSLMFMLKNKKLAKKASRSLFYTFRLQLMYKSELYGNKLIIADKFFPSTQTCCFCGYVKTGSDKMKLGQDTYKCDNCNEEIDRDVNAAINLMNY